MTQQVSKPNRFNAICENFASRHEILTTPLLEHESVAIFWTNFVKLEIDAELKDNINKLERLDPPWAILLSMLDRTFEYVEGA
jgi:hypothetical protein